MLREGDTTTQHQSWCHSWDVGLQSSCMFSLPCHTVSWTSLCLKPFPASASSSPAHHLECICCQLRAVGPMTWAGRLQSSEGLTCRCRRRNSYATGSRGLWFSLQGPDWSEWARPTPVCPGRAARSRAGPAEVQSALGWGGVGRSLGRLPGGRGRKEGKGLKGGSGRAGAGTEWWW